MGCAGSPTRASCPRTPCASASPPPGRSGAGSLSDATRASPGRCSPRALSAGAASGGADVVDLGVLPTPGVAALAPRLGATAAGVVSASHNPYPDNGIKFFSGEGRKLSPEKEGEIEDLLEHETPRPTGSGIGGGRGTRRRRAGVRGACARTAASVSRGHQGAPRLRQRGRLRGGAARVRGGGRGPHPRRASNLRARTSTMAAARPTSMSSTLRATMWLSPSTGTQTGCSPSTRRATSSTGTGSSPSSPATCKERGVLARRGRRHGDEQPRLLQGDGGDGDTLRGDRRGGQARRRGHGSARGVRRRGAVGARDPLRARHDRGRAWSRRSRSST